MIETWRWFGPKDKVTLNDIKQTGASGIVTSLYHLEPGSIWGKNEISTRLEEITGSKNDPTNLTWDVVEHISIEATALLKDAPLDTPALRKSLDGLGLMHLNKCAKTRKK